MFISQHTETVHLLTGSLTLRVFVFTLYLNVILFTTGLLLYLTRRDGCLAPIWEIVGFGTHRLEYWSSQTNDFTIDT